MPNGVFIPNVKGFLPQTALHKSLEKYCSLLQVPLQQPDSYFTQKLHWTARSQTYTYKRQSHKNVSGHSLSRQIHKKMSAYMQFLLLLLFSNHWHTHLSFHVRGVNLTLCEKCVICAHAPSSSPQPFARSHAHAAEWMSHIPSTWQHQLNIACQCQPSSSLGSGFALPPPPPPPPPPRVLSSARAFTSHRGTRAGCQRQQFI